jgi:hypothetical protein
MTPASTPRVRLTTACSATAILMALGLGSQPVTLHAADGTDNAAPFTLTRNLNFRINYPRFLRFRVGATGAVINQITFTVPANQVGLGTPIAGTGGEAGGGSAATVQVVANNGQVTITATNNSGGLGLGNGVVADPRINYNQISTSTSDGNLPAPALTNAGGTTSLPVLTTAPYVTNRTATWTFAYVNSTVPAPGTYGTSARGGRVTFTATMP